MASKLMVRMPYTQSIQWMAEYCPCILCQAENSLLLSCRWWSRFTSVFTSSVVQTVLSCRFCFPIFYMPCFVMIKKRMMSYFPIGSYSKQRTMVYHSVQATLEDNTEQSTMVYRPVGSVCWRTMINHFVVSLIKQRMMVCHCVGCMYQAEGSEIQAIY